MKVRIYHNPRCSKSRETLNLIRARGVEPEVVEYLNETPSAQELRQLADGLGVPLHGLLRAKEPAYRELGLAPESSDAEILDAIAREPRLLERPIVVRGKRAVFGRPPENALELLD